MAASEKGVRVNTAKRGASTFQNGLTPRGIRRRSELPELLPLKEGPVLDL